MAFFQPKINWFLILSLAFPFQKSPFCQCANIADESNFVDSDIPKDWRNYFPADIALQTAKVTDQAKGIFQGDITGIHPESAIPNTADFSKPTLTLWRGGDVLYQFDSNIERHAKELVLTAMKDIESKSCVRFLLRRTQEEHFLNIAGGTSCSSNVGQTGGSQTILINAGCLDGLGALQHELLHALGLIHEQSRPDRNLYVWINKKNMQQGAEADFVQQSLPALVELNVTYDYASIMHYPWNAFAINQAYPTIIPKARKMYIGLRKSMSRLDIQRLNKLYQCDRVRRSENPTADYSEIWQDWRKLCDGFKDTPEGWDEIPDVCLTMCEKLDHLEDGSSLGLFNLPVTRRCMHKRYLCDGIKDSETDVSENKTICQQFCKGGGYVAIAPSYQCIQFQYLCNGYNNTLDGSDEIRKNCDVHCKALADLPKYRDDFFQLEPLGRCMVKSWLCDGMKSNKFDQTEEVPVCQRYCKGGGYFNTANTKECIHWRMLCDGTTDTSVATDNWDEEPEMCLAACPSVPGLIGHLVNLPGTLRRCIRLTSLCDGKKDGADDVSENPQVCQQLCRGNGYFPAPDTLQCIRVTSLCDGVKDTRNGWDELLKHCIQYCHRGTHNNVTVHRKAGSRQCFEG